MHEGVDLAWRVLDAGCRVHYAGDVGRPAPVADRRRPHGYSSYYGARNRVWLARRYLPLPLGALFVADVRAADAADAAASRAALRAALRGYRDGLRGPCRTRRRLRGRTLWRMARAGRPPVI